MRREVRGEERKNLMVRVIAGAATVLAGLACVLALGCAAGTTPDPVVSVTPTSLDFGATDTQKSLAVANTGGGALVWTVSSDEDWITLSPEIGLDDATVTVTVDRSALAVDFHTAAITVASNAGSATVGVTVVPVMGSGEVVISGNGGAVHDDSSRYLVGTGRSGLPVWRGGTGHGLWGEYVPHQPGARAGSGSQSDPPGRRHGFGANTRPMARGR